MAGAERALRRTLLVLEGTLVWLEPSSAPDPIHGVDLALPLPPALILRPARPWRLARAGVTAARRCMLRWPLFPVEHVGRSSPAQQRKPRPACARAKPCARFNFPVLPLCCLYCRHQVAMPRLVGLRRDLARPQARAGDMHRYPHTQHIASDRAFPRPHAVPPPPPRAPRRLILATTRGSTPLVSQSE